MRPPQLESHAFFTPFLQKYLFLQKLKRALKDGLETDNKTHFQSTFLDSTENWPFDPHFRIVELVVSPRLVLKQLRRHHLELLEHQTKEYFIGSVSHP